VRLPLHRIVAVAPFLVFAGVYLAAAGHGFIKDDFAWILQSRVRDTGDLAGLFVTDNGFYRPMVALTFTVNDWMFGAAPRGYGVTNVLLALLCGASIYMLARAFALSRGAAIMAAALWLLNLQGIRMAALWTSGRTALVLTLAATMAATAVVRGRLGPAVAWTLVALFAKEEAVLLPAILFGWLLVLRTPEGPSRISAGTWIAVSAGALGLYFFARSFTAASTPWSAPWYYTPSIDVSMVLSNVLSYGDRVGTVPLAVTLLALLALGRAQWSADRAMTRLLVCGAIWLVGGFGATVFLPVRSDLYACFPSVAVCLAAAAICGRSWQASTEVRRRRALVGALVLVVAMTPVYWARTERWSSLAKFSAAILADLAAATRHLPDDAVVVIQDDRTTRVNLDTAIGTLMQDAVVVTTGRRLVIQVEPPLGGADPAGVAAPCDTCVSVRLRVSGGRLVPDSAQQSH
jgi:hypothetical protein